MQRVLPSLIKAGVIEHQPIGPNWDGRPNCYVLLHAAKGKGITPDEVHGMKPEVPSGTTPQRLYSSPSGKKNIIKEEKKEEREKGNLSAPLPNAEGSLLLPNPPLGAGAATSAPVCEQDEGERNAQATDLMAILHANGYEEDPRPKPVDTGSMAPEERQRHEQAKADALESRRKQHASIRLALEKIQLEKEQASFNTPKS